MYRMDRCRVCLWQSKVEMRQKYSTCRFVLKMMLGNKNAWNLLYIANFTASSAKLLEENLRVTQMTAIFSSSFSLSVGLFARCVLTLMILDGVGDKGAE